MPDGTDDMTAAGAIPRRLFYYNFGFQRQKRLRRILALSGHQLCAGLPSSDDAVVVWGQSPYAARGDWMARKRQVPLVRLEDSFLRSVHPGRTGAPPLGLIIDPLGVHFDGRNFSLIEQILAQENFDNSNLLLRASDGIARIQDLNLSKYNNFDDTLDGPAPGYVLVVDQTVNDASLRCCNAGRDAFKAMLAKAKSDHPTLPIVIKTHPETQQNLRPGHFGPEDAGGRVTLLTTPVSPWRLLAGAAAVYTVSSQLGFEAILSGHRPHVFGQPFYAGWGLSTDDMTFPRRTKPRSKEQLFAAAMIVAPTWYDPCRDRLCTFEQAIDQLDAETRAFREDRRGYVAFGMRMWKRRRLQSVFGQQRPILFANDPATALAVAKSQDRDLLVWAGKAPKEFAAPEVFSGKICRVEDGFLRSRGLGADLVPPLSLVSDDLGIYYDPTRESRFERLMTRPLPAPAIVRAVRLRAQLIDARLSKYNLGGSALPEFPEGRKILVPGQVEDDASILLGTGPVKRNLDLIRAVRSANPDAVLIYKPHPDVEAGLRQGQIAAEDLCDLVDVVAIKSDPIALIDAVDEVWTMTSLLGFEALLRGKNVTCLGAPFYAGWGLTQDLGGVPARRRNSTFQPDLPHLVHAALIRYPRYFDPVGNLPCPAEVAVERLRDGTIPTRSAGLRLLAKMQGYFASHAAWWR